MKTQGRNGSAKALSCLLLLLGIVLLGTGLIFRPGFFATHVSRDGVLEPVTSFCIVVFDIGVAAIGIGGLVTGVGLMRHPDAWRQRMARFIQVPPAPDGRGKRSVFAVSLRIGGMHFSLISLAVMALVIGLKVYWGFSVPRVPIEKDAKAYSKLAKNIAEGKGYVVGDEPWTQTPPVWPATFAATYVLSNRSIAACYLVQTMFGCAVVLMIYGMGRYFFGEATGVLAAVLLGTYPSMIWMEGTLLTEPTYVFLLVGFVILATMASVGGGKLSAAFCGIAFAVLLLCRGILLYFWPCLWASLLIAGRPRPLKSRVGQVLIATGCAVLVVLPWSFSLSRTCGQFVPISVPTYHALWSASRGFVWPGFSDDRVEAFMRGKRFATWTDRQNYLREDAIREIKRNPMPYLKLVVSGPRTLLRAPMLPLWRLEHHPTYMRPLTDYYTVIDKGLGLVFGTHHQVKSPAQAALRHAWWYDRYFDGIIVLWLVGTVLSLKAWRKLLPVYFVVVYTILFQSVVGLPKARYLLPIMPFIFLFASVAVTQGPCYYIHLAAKQDARDAGVAAADSSIEENGVNRTCTYGSPCVGENQSGKEKA